MANTDTYQIVTNQIIESLEQVGENDWTCPWDRQTSLPRNGKSGISYNGVNILTLWAAQMTNNFSSQEWFTYNQAKALGGHVRKGESHSAKVVYWRFMTVPKDEEEISKAEWKAMSKKEKEQAEKDGKTKTIPLCKYHQVFNRDQCEGLPEAKSTEGPESSETIMAFVKDAGVKVRDGGMAAYNSTKDMVYMPPLETFRSSDDYHSVLFHEVTHWTGHKSRLNRDLNNRFGDEAYAMEELVAEMGAAFLGAKMGVPYEGCQHPEYVKHWVSKLQEDKYAIFTAARAAKEAVEFLEDEVESQRTEQVA